jgi:diadenosine tetraphosphatase ApaH/serine/threonine PP2A family protein phosphatase
MRYLIISDIHANLAALAAVLADADGSFDFVWCLGDVVGYGPNPNECIERLRDLPHFSLAGNHDWASLGKLDLTSFNNDARIASVWTQGELTPSSRAYLEKRPTHSIQEDMFTLAHASPRQPVWEYVLDPLIARRNFAYFETPFCLVGHTHIPIIFHQSSGDFGGCTTISPPYNGPVYLESEGRMIINPGSVGQPRDGNPLASYAILDTSAMTWEHRRVAYAIEITQERMRARELPPRLIERLQYGR